MYLKRIKVITSHAGLARWLAEHDVDGAIGYLPRFLLGHIPSPYFYSPTVPVWLWRGKRVVWFETRHKRYEVYEVSTDLPVHDEKEAIDLHVRATRRQA